MSPTTTITIRVPTSLKRRLNRLARQSKFSKSRLVTEAIHQYVDEQERRAAVLRKADREIDAGQFIPHSEVRRWLLSWGTALSR